MLGVPTHQPQRPGWRGFSTSAQLLGARLGPLAHTQPRAESAGKVARRGGGKNATYRVWGLDFGQGWQQSEAGQTVSPPGDGQFGQGLRRGWGGGKGEGRKTPVRFGVPRSLALARAPPPPPPPALWPPQTKLGLARGRPQSPPRRLKSEPLGLRDSGADPGGAGGARGGEGASPLSGPERATASPPRTRRPSPGAPSSPRRAAGLQTPACSRPRPSFPSSPPPNAKGSLGLGLLGKNAGTHAGLERLRASPTQIFIISVEFVESRSPPSPNILKHKRTQLGNGFPVGWPLWRGFGAWKDSSPVIRRQVLCPPGTSDKRTLVSQPPFHRVPGTSPRLIGFCQASLAQVPSSSSRATPMLLSSETRMLGGRIGLFLAVTFPKPLCHTSRFKAEDVANGGCQVK